MFLDISRHTLADSLLPCCSREPPSGSSRAIYRWRRAWEPSPPCVRFSSEIVRRRRSCTSDRNGGDPAHAMLLEFRRTLRSLRRRATARRRCRAAPSIPGHRPRGKAAEKQQRDVAINGRFTTAVSLNRLRLELAVSVAGNLELELAERPC